jgi:hypothetical protein
VDSIIVHHLHYTTLSSHIWIFWKLYFVGSENLDFAKDM